MPASSRVATALALLFTSGLAACGGGAADGGPPPATPGDPGPPPAAGGAKSGPMPPIATVNGVAVSNKGDHFTRVTVTFKNPGGTPCKITGYTLSWGGGRKNIPLEGKDFIVQPGASEVRAIRIHPSDGDITNLISPDGTKVEVESDCGK